MIPILKIVNWFTKNFKVVAVSFIMLLAAISFYMHNQLEYKDKQINALQNNIEFYQSVSENEHNRNIVLQMTVDELNQSKDSLLQQITKIQKQLDIKNKKLISTNVINTQIKDSIKTIIKPIDRDFIKELNLNQLTTIIVSRIDSTLSVKLDLQNQQILFIEDTKEYKKKYKNGFIRFLHLDWRKKHVRKYNIYNSNDLIKITDSRIVEIIK